MLNKILVSIIELIQKTRRDDIFAISAQFSYYIILSVFPFLILTISAFSQYSVYLLNLLELGKEIIPSDVYKMINSIVRNSSDGTDGAFMSASIIAILWSASSGSAAVIRGINKAYDFPLKRNYFFMRIKGLFFTVALMISMQFIFAAVFVGGRVIEFFCCMNSYSGVLFPLIDILRYAAAFLLLFVLFMLTYKFLPYERIRFRQALPGAIFSAAGFIAGSYFFSSYINTRMEYYYNIYGSLSSVFVLLLWIYISSMIFLTGAEINASIKYCK